MTSRRNKIGAITGIGIDIEDIARFRKKPFGKNKAFYKKIFTEKEIKYCFGRANPYRHFAARFCAKEAVIKASGKNLLLNQIEVLKQGKNPKIVVKGHNLNTLVSLSHTKDYATAIVILTE